jgi:transcriptional regulator of acetoin/glycerol metabolism
MKTNARAQIMQRNAPKFHRFKQSMQNDRISGAWRRSLTENCALVRQNSDISVASGISLQKTNEDASHMVESNSTAELSRILQQKFVERNGGWGAGSSR